MCANENTGSVLLKLESIISWLYNYMVFVVTRMQQGWSILS